MWIVWGDVETNVLLWGSVEMSGRQCDGMSFSRQLYLGAGGLGMMGVEGGGG